MRADRITQLHSSRILRAGGAPLRPATPMEPCPVGSMAPRPGSMAAPMEPCSMPPRPGSKAAPMEPCPVGSMPQRPGSMAAPMEPCPVGSMPQRPGSMPPGSMHRRPVVEPCASAACSALPPRLTVAEPCSSVACTASPMQMTGTSFFSVSGGVAEVPMAAPPYAANRGGHVDINVSGADVNRDSIPDKVQRPRSVSPQVEMMQRRGSIPLQADRVQRPGSMSLHNMTNLPLIYQTQCPNVYQDGPTSQFPVTAPLHASPHPPQHCVLAAGAKLVSVGESTPPVVEDGCYSNDIPQQVFRPPSVQQSLLKTEPLAQQSMPKTEPTVPLQAGQDYSELQHGEPTPTQESQLLLRDQLIDIGKCLEVINRSSTTSEERCSESESAIAEIRASIKELKQDINLLQSRFLVMSEVPASGSFHNDVETLRTQHLRALSAIEEQRHEHSQLHTMHAELRELLTEHGNGLQELQVRAQPSDIQNEVSLVSNMQQQHASKLQELEAHVVKHIQDMEQTAALSADRHLCSKTQDSFMAEAERQEQTLVFEELTNYIQETRQDIFSTVDSALDEVRSEIKALSAQLNSGMPHQVREVNGINSGIMDATVAVGELDGHVCSGPLKISILGASGLRNADWIGKSDPYCTCEILAKPDAGKIKTHVIKNNLNPTWDYEAELSEFEAGDILVFKVYDEDFGKKDDFLGTLSVMSEQFYPHGFEGDLPLQEAGTGITANLRLRIPPAIVVNSIPAVQPVAEAPIQLPAVFGQEDPAIVELREQLGCLTEAVRNELNGLHESFGEISRGMQGTEMALGGPDVSQLATTLESEMAKRVESEALLQHELANVAVCVEQLLHREPVNVDSPGPEPPGVQLALTKAEQSLVASSNLQDGVQEMQQEFFKLAQQQTRLEGGLAGLDDLRSKVDRMRAELESRLEEY